MLEHDSGQVILGLTKPVSYTHLRAHETVSDLVCRLLLEKENFEISYKDNQVLIFNLKRKSFQILNEAN